MGSILKKGKRLLKKGHKALKKTKAYKPLKKLAKKTVKKVKHRALKAGKKYVRNKIQQKTGHHMKYGGGQYGI